MDFRSLVLLWLFIVGVLSGQVISHYLLFPDQPKVDKDNMVQEIPVKPIDNTSVRPATYWSWSDDYTTEFWANGTVSNVTYVTYVPEHYYNITGPYYNNRTNWTIPENYTTIYYVGGGGGGGVGSVYPHYMAVDNVTG